MNDDRRRIFLVPAVACKESEAAETELDLPGERDFLTLTLILLRPKEVWAVQRDRAMTLETIATLSETPMVPFHVVAV
jgi:hypothetical protein